MNANCGRTGTQGWVLRRRRLLATAGGLGATATGVALLSTACALLPFAAKARVPRIGVLVPGSREAYADRSDAFLQGLRDLGYVEGQTIAIEWRYTPEGTENQFAEMASELVRLSMDVIVVDGSTVAVQAAKQATSTIPIVFLVLTSPVETGLVASLARPGGNLTGITSSAPGQFAKWAQVLQDVVPGLTRPVVLVFPSNPTTVAVWDEFRTAGESAGLQVQRIDLRLPRSSRSRLKKPPCVEPTPWSLRRSHC